MKLTGKAKQEFEKWFLKGMRTDEGYDQYVMRSFSSKAESMKWGVYVDFADSLNNRVDIICRICILIMETQKGFAYTINGSVSDTFKTRPEARTAAIEKFNEIFNNTN